MTKKFTKWENLLNRFVEYDHLDDCRFLEDPVGYTTWLYGQVNEAGFKLACQYNRDQIQHAKNVKLAVHSMFSNAWNPGDEESSMQIKLVKGKGGPTYLYDILDEVNRASLVKIPFVSVGVLSSEDSNYFFDLDESGENGIIFVMKFCLEAAEIGHVVKCNECSRFFFAKRSDAIYCSPNCKTVSNRRREKYGR